MVFGFLKQSGGHVGVYSELDKGTTFRLYLPRVVPAALSQDNRLIVRAAPGGSETILVVEDNPGLRRIVVRQLGDAGYRVLEAPDAEAAMTIITGHEPIDLLLTDIVMPGEMDGRELARVAIARRPALRTLLTSGFPDVRLSSAATSARSSRLLSKPYRKEELRQAVRDAIDDTTR
jgi:CheY-like chemotaxis protein